MEGLGDFDSMGNTKVTELQNHMSNLGLHILCIQETHATGSVTFTTPEGYLVILSGGGPLADGMREYAGVGYIVAPSMARSVISYLQHSSRCLTVLSDANALFGRGYSINQKSF